MPVFGDLYQEKVMTSPVKKKRKSKVPGLSLHQNGTYFKRFKGHTYYFGKDPDVALRRFHREWSYILEGKDPRSPEQEKSSVTLQEIVNKYLEFKHDEMENCRYRSWVSNLV
jgi:hypothetical protein